MEIVPQLQNTFADCSMVELVEELRNRITHQGMGVTTEEHGYVMHQLKSLVSWLENENLEEHGDL